jgi:RNA polymerase primary sigma factor
MSPEEQVGETVLRDQLDTMLETLTERERTILELRFGLRDGHCRTLGEIGDHIGITRERVRQIQQKALTDCERTLEWLISGLPGLKIIPVIVRRMA